MDQRIADLINKIENEKMENELLVKQGFLPEGLHQALVWKTLIVQEILPELKKIQNCCKECGKEKCDCFADEFFQ